MKLRTYLLITIITACSAFGQIANTNITSYGQGAGTDGTGNSYFGYRAGYGAPTYNVKNFSTYLGYQAGEFSYSNNNTMIGYRTGRNNTDGIQNVFIGSLAAEQSLECSNNVVIGYSAARYSNGSNNTIIGYNAGLNNDNSNNIFIGYNAGSNETGSNKLYISNSQTSTPLVWGDFALSQLKLNGKVGIGMNSSSFPTSAASYNVSNYKLIVNGGVLATEVRVATTWADYVFEDDYELPTLEEVECYIEENGHLPNVPTAQEVEEDGIEIGEISKIQQEKIEELTLYAIQQQKQIDKQQQEIEELKAMVKALAERN